MDLGGERLMRFPRVDRHRGLPENRAAIDLGCFIMEGAARFDGACAQGLADSVQTGEFRKEARMKGDDAARGGAEEPGLQHPHEPCEEYEIRPRRRNGRDEAGLPLALELGPEGRRVYE